MTVGKSILVTGGAGFIGSAVVRHLISESTYRVINVDALTYAGNLATVSEVSDNERYHFEHVNICDAQEVRRLFQDYRPDAVIHLAAESHVDRSIDGPAEFIQTNIVGTYTLLEESRRFLSEIDEADRRGFRFHHVSTDEVFGSLGETGAFTESSPYQPNSPYSASKASSDHLVRAWSETFGLPTLISNCSNNYGPYQFPEKLIPVVISKAIGNSPIPVYGAGENIRDWLYVEDHARALVLIATTGETGRTYNVGGNSEKTNLEVVRSICRILDRVRPRSDSKSYSEQITFVEDRPGHDFRYAIDASRIQSELGWTPRETFESGMEKTIEWYLKHGDWVKEALAGSYGGERLGLATKS